MATTTRQPRLISLLFEPDRELSHIVEAFLGQTFAEAMASITQELALTAKELKEATMDNYQNPEQLRTNWQIATLLPPLTRTRWSYLTHTDPKKSGVLCGEPTNPFLLTQEFLDQSRDLHCSELYWQVDAWRDTTQLIWAARIVQNLLRTVRPNQLALPGPIKPPTEEDCTIDKPIGTIVNLPEATDTELLKIKELEHTAAFGSNACAAIAGVALRDWCRAQPLASLIEEGFTVEEVHWLLYTLGPRYAEIDFQLIWIQELGSYELCLGISNRDRHGYPDKDRSFYLPVQRLGHFYEDSSQETKSHLVRLAIRQSWKKAWDLAYPALVLGDDFL